MIKKYILPTLFSTLVSIPVVADDQPVVPVADHQTPAVPASVVEQALANAKPKTKPDQDASHKAMKSSYKPFVMSIEPGINQLIPISIGHYNRIVTPFEKPFINTVSDATIEVHKNIIYVATSDDTPVTMFISPDIDDESMALSLTLAPKKIPPIEANLKLDEEVVANFPIRTKAKKWEESQPYVDGVVTAMRTLALGDIPDGYAMSKMRQGDAYPTCLQKGMTYDFANGQYLRGHHFNIAIGTIRNTSSTTMEINEYSCIDGSIVAVSAWPETVLQPGKASELFVMMRTVSKPVVTRKRKSLLQQERN